LSPRVSTGPAGSRISSRGLGQLQLFLAFGVFWSFQVLSELFFQKKKKGCNARGQRPRTKSVDKTRKERENLQDAAFRGRLRAGGQRAIGSRGAVRAPSSAAAGWVRAVPLRHPRGAACCPARGAPRAARRGRRRGGAGGAGLRRDPRASAHGHGPRGNWREKVRRSGGLFQRGAGAECGPARRAGRRVCGAVLLVRLCACA